MHKLPDHVRMLPKWLTAHEQAHLDNHTPSDGWEPGRQGGGYHKRNIENLRPMRRIVVRALAELGEPTLYDAWLMRYPSGSSIPPHIDPQISGMQHVRLNAIINRGFGGLLRVSEVDLPLDEGDAYIFRPDLVKHEVGIIETGTRLVLSVGANVTPDHAERLGLA